MKSVAPLPTLSAQFSDTSSASASSWVWPSGSVCHYIERLTVTTQEVGNARMGGHGPMSGVADAPMGGSGTTILSFRSEDGVSDRAPPSARSADHCWTSGPSRPRVAETDRNGSDAGAPG